MATSDYNGYSNRATWNVNLWLGNEEPLYRRAQSFVRERGGAVNATMAESFVRGLWPDGTTPDGCKLSEVNWHEIADALDELGAE